MNFFRKNFKIIAVVFVGLAMFAFISRYLFWDEESAETREITVKDVPFTPEGELTIYQGDTPVKTLEIEFARTESERELGLMYRSSMAENRGMLFIFPDENIRAFYMKNTQISLDIIYINSQNKIIDIAKRAKPYDETSLPSSAPAKYVLEVNGGMTDKWGVKVGDTIRFQ